MAVRRRAPRSLAMLALAAAALALAAPHAAAASGYGVVISQELLARDGTPSLVANFSPDGSLATPSWAVCAPAAALHLENGATIRVRIDRTPLVQTFAAAHQVVAARVRPLGSR
jgi:hypothetical protein